MTYGHPSRVTYSRALNIATLIAAFLQGWGSGLAGPFAFDPGLGGRSARPGLLQLAYHFIVCA